MASPGSQRRTRRGLIVLLAAIVFLLVALGSTLAFLSTLIWTRNLDVESDGDRVIELQREARPDVVEE